MNNAFVFAIGATIGSVVTYLFTRTKYEKLANEDINEMREYYDNLIKKETPVEEDGPEPEQEEKKDIEEYKSMVKGYSTFSNKKQEDEQEDVELPYVISPEEFGEFEDYSTISLTYYSNGVLTDDNDEKIDDIEDTVGDALEHFGEYEDDAVHVRDDRKKVDYEILKDLDEWEE